jgi:hypothetical protein
MGIIQVPGRLSGKTYSVNIKGDTPSETEQARIRAYLDEQERAFATEYEATLGKPLAQPDDGTALGRGLERGKASAKSLFGTTIETIGQQVGLPSIAEYGRGMEDAAAQRQFELSLLQPAPTTRQDVVAAEGFFPTIGAGLTYAGELAGEQLPQLGTSLAGGAVGAAVGSFGGPAGALAGFGIGSGLTEAPMLFGANVQRQEEEVAAGRRDAVDLTDALGSTVGQAGITAVTNALAGAGVFVRPGAKLFTRALSGAAVGGTTESLNEVGQQILERYQAGLPVDSPDAIQEYIDAGVAGGVLGVAAGGIGGAVGGPRLREAPGAATATINPADLQTQMELPLTPSTRPGFVTGQEQGELFLPTAPEVGGSVLPAKLELQPTPEEEQLSLGLEAAAVPAEVPVEPTLKKKPTTVPKATATAVPKAAVPVTNEAVAKSEVLPAETVPGIVSAESTVPVLTDDLVTQLGVGTAKSAPLRKMVGKPLTDSAVVRTLNRWAQNDKATAANKALVARLITGQPAPEAPAIAPKQEAPNVPEAAAVKPEEVGVGVPSGGPSVEGSGGVDSIATGSTGTETPTGGGLGGDMSVPVAADTAAGTERPALTAPAFTGSPTELQVRDAQRQLAPMRDVREVASNSAAQSELEAAWTARMADKPELASLIDEYSTPDALVLDDPTTSEDKRRVLGLLQPGAIKKGKKGMAPAENAQMYFSQFKRPIDALEFIVADATLKNQRFKNQKALETETGALPAGDETISPAEREFFSGMTQERAKQALAWVEANMSPQAQVKVRDLQRKYRKAQEAKVPMRAVSSLPSSTAIGGRAANTEERAALEQELTAQAKTKAAQKAEGQRLVSLGGKGLDALLGAVQETKVPPQKRAAGMRKMTAEDQIDFVTDQILGLRFNRPQDVLDLGSPLHPAVVNQLRRGNLELALRALQMYAPNDRIKRIVRALAPYATGTSVRIVDDLRDDRNGAEISGQYRLTNRRQTSELLLDSVYGMDVATLLHEMTHAATARELLNEASPMRKRMEQIFADVAPKLGQLNGQKNLFEFVADAFSDPQFQRELSQLYPDGKPISAVQRFTNEIINLVRRLIGLQPRQLRSALDITDQMVMQILDFPISVTDISTPEEGATILNRVAQIDGSFPGRTKEFAQQFGDDASSVLSGASWGAKRTVLGFMGMQPLADVAAHYKIDGAYDLQDGVQQMDAAAVKSDQEVDGVLQIAQKWVKNNPNLKPLFDRVVTRSTVNQVDPSLTREKALKKYGADSDKMRMYDALQKDWAAIGRDGHDLYNNMRQLYRKQYERLREALSGKIDFILSSNPTLAAEVKQSIYTKFFDMNRIEPYFPLARKGDYWLEYSAFDPETNTTEPVKEAYESPRARDRAAKELEAMSEVTKGPDGKPIFNYYSTLDVVRQGRTPDSLFVRDTLSIIRSNLANTGVDAATASSIQQEITKLFVDALPETSFAKSLQRRKNTRGYMEDSLEALRVKGYSLGRQGVRYAYSNKIRAVSDAIQDQARNTNDQNKVAVVEELVARANFATNPPADMLERMVQTVNRGAFTFTIGLNVSSALVNLSSVPVVLYPYLAGRYGSRSSAAAIGSAYKLFLNSGLSREIELPAQFEGQKTTKVRAMPSIDNYFVLNSNNEYVLRDDIAPELRPMLQELAPLVDVASKNGQLNRSIYYDSIGAEDVGRARSFGDRFSAISGALFHQVERANRQVTLVAAYNLELARLRNKPTEAERGLTEDQRRTRAAERAVYQATETGGGSTLATAPRWAQKGIGRVALMYKNFGLSLFYMQMKLIKQLTLGSNDPDFTPEDRRVAFKQLVGLQLSSFAFAGIAGVPLYGLVSTVANAFLGDDEEDADMLTRRYLGEGIYKGFLSDISGFDISSRIGLTGLLLRENRYNTDASAEETLVAAIGGPAWSTATQFGRGISEFYTAMTGGEGDMVRGIENMVPAAVRNFIKAGRYLADGASIETRRKDVITGDLGSSDLLGQMLGFTPTKATLQQDINQLKVRISNEVSKKRSELSKLYYIALRQGDIEGAQEAMADIRAFNAEIKDRFPEAVIDGEFLKDSLKSHQRTSKEMSSGVSINPIVREALIDLEGMYNQGFQLF